MNLNTQPDNNMVVNCNTMSASLNACGVLGTSSFLIPGATTSYSVDTIVSSMIDTTGSTTVTFTDNQWNNTAGRVALAAGSNFNFCFYGVKYNYVYMSDNGYVRFSNLTALTNVGYTAAALPSATSANPAVLGHSKDYKPALNGRYCWKITTVNGKRALVFSFMNIRNNNTCNNSGYDHIFQIVLYEFSNVVEVLTNRVSSCTAGDNAICGVQNAGGTTASWANHYDGSITTRNFDNYSLNTVTKGNMVRFTPNGAPVHTFEWYDVTANSVIATTPAHTVTGLTFAMLPRKYVARVVYTQCDGVNTTFTDTVTVLPPNITATITAIPTSCNAANDTATNSAWATYGKDGKITINNVTGGTSGYVYTINPTPPGSNVIYTPSPTVADTIRGLTGSTAGTCYTITITDAGGCTATFTTCITSPPAAAISLPPGGSFQVPCVQTNFAATFTTSGGNGGFPPTTYTITPNVPYQSGPPAGYAPWTVGTYTVMNKDVKGCLVTKSYNVVNPPAIVLTQTSKTDIVCGTGTGSFAFTRTGGYNGPTPPPVGTPWFTYTLSPPSGTISISPPPGATPGPFQATHTVTCSGLAYGTYTATATDYRGCTSTSLFTIDTFGKPTIATDSLFDLTCNLSNNGRIYTTPASITSSLTHTYVYSCTLTGGTPAITPIINATGDYTGLPFGTYTLTVTDNKSCSATKTFTLTQPPVVTVTLDSSANPLCSSGATGYARVVVTSLGNGSPFTYTASPATGVTQTIINANTQGFSNLTGSTIYTFTAVDPKGCSGTTTVALAFPTVLSIAGTTAIPLCVGDSSGKIFMTYTGGTGAVTYTTGNAYEILVVDTITHLPQGTYVVIGTDANNCTAATTVTIVDPVAITATAVYDTASCNGICDAGITINAAGGAGSYSYQLNTGAFQSANSFTSLCAGPYTITVRDNNNCTETFVFNVPQPGVLTFAIDSSKALTCATSGDGILWYTINGGTPPFTVNTLGSGPLTQLTSRTFRNNGLDCNAYTITISDANTCSTTGAFTAACPAPITHAAVAVTDALCYDSCSGSAVLSGITGGTPFAGNKYLFTLDSVQNNTVSCLTFPIAYLKATSFTISNLSAGEYFGHITDTNGCTRLVTFIVNEPTPTSISIVSTFDATCNNLCNGIAVVTATGGTNTFTYSGAPLWVADSAKNLCAGTTYTLMATDGNGCKTTVTTTIGQPTAILLPNILVAPTCFGFCDGMVNMNISGGTSPYTISTNPVRPISNDTISGLCANTVYTVNILDANNCLASTTVSLLQPSQLAPSIVSIDSVNCFGDSTGGAVATATGATPSYSYSWSSLPPQSNATLTNVPAGTYFCTVTDANGCVATTSAAITQANQITITGAALTHVVCNGASTGSATLTTIGGKPPYTISPSTTGLAAGTYTFTASDVYGCSTTTVVTITQNPVVGVTIYAVNIPCFGSNAGDTLKALPTGGTGTYTYQWSSGQVAQTIWNVPAGTYTVTVSSPAGCTSSATAIITQPPVILVPNVKVSPTCNGLCNGFVNMNASGGTPPYNYSISPSAGTSISNDTISGLCASQLYVITVTDANGCTRTTTANLTQPAVFTATISSIDSVTCNGLANGDACVTTAGGTAPPTYLWSNAQTGSCLTNVVAGTYSVLVTDAKGCTSATTVTIYQPPALQYDNVTLTHVSCLGGNNGNAAITVSGGTAPISISPSTASLVANTYTFNATDALGCSLSTVVTITQPPTAVSIAVAATANPTCVPGSDGFIAVTASGGTSGYSFSQGSTYVGSTGFAGDTLKNLITGTYTIWVTDNNGCFTNATATLINNNAPVLSYISDSITCAGDSDGSLYLSLTGGTSPFTYAWSCSAIDNDTITGLPAGPCSVTVTDFNGCQAILACTVPGPDSVKPLIVSTTTVACNGDSTGAAAASTSGGTLPYSYAWSNGDATANLVTVLDGTYSLTVTDAYGCTGTTSVSIAEPPVLSVALNVVSHVSCNGGNDGAITVNGVGGFGIYNIIVNPGTSSLDSGVYTFTVQDANLCTATASITITEPLAPLVTTVVATQNPTCMPGSDGFIVVTSTGGTGLVAYAEGATYAGSTALAADSATALAAGTYTIWSTDANGCTTSTTASIANSNAPIVTFTVDSVNCFGGSDGAVDLNISNGTPPYTFSWSCSASTDSFATGLSSGNCNVTVTDVNMCDAVVNILVPQPADIVITVDSIKNVSCFGLSDGAAYISVSGGTLPYSYTWNGNPSTQDLTGLAAGTYTVNVADAYGCQKTVTVTITQPTVLSASANITSHVSCFGGNNGAVTVNGSGGTLPYTITGSAQTSLTAGTYNYTVTDANGCVATTSATITQPPTAVSVSIVSSTNPSCTPGNDGSIVAAGTGGVGGFTYTQGPAYPAIGLLTGLGAGNYTVWATDANGCTTNTTITLNNSNGAVVSFILDSVDCNGGTDGGIILVVDSLGTPPFTFSWTCSADTDSIVSNLPAGPCSVTISDANSCQATYVIPIYEPPTLTASFTQINDSCNGANKGSINLTVNGGTAPYSYLWNTSATSQDLNNIGAGTYSVVVTDAKGCQTTISSIVITEPSALTLTVNSVTHVTCNGLADGSVNLTIGGGTLPYATITPATTGLANGTYTFTTADALGCTTSVQVNISQPNPLTAVLDSTRAVRCFGDCNGAAYVTATGGSGTYDYTWNCLGTTTAFSFDTTLCAGPCSVTITDDSGCVATVPFNITTPTPFVFDTSLYVSTPPTSSLLCNGTIVVNGASGGTTPYSYQMFSTSGINNSVNIGWQANNLFDSLCAPDTILIIATDKNGCGNYADTMMIPVTAPTFLTATADSFDQSCTYLNDGEIVVNAAGSVGPYTYNITPTPGAAFPSYNGALNQTVTWTPVPPGTYTITVYASNGDSVQVTTTVNQAVGLNIANTIVQPLCGIPGSVDVTGSGGNGTLSAVLADNAYATVYGPQTVATTFTGVSAGSYYLITQDLNGCADTQSITLINPSALIASNVSTTAATCVPGNDGCINFTINGFSGALTATINGGAPLPITAVYSECTYAPGIYTIEVLDAATNCSVIIIDTVESSPNPTISITNIDSVNCFGEANGSVAFTASTGANVSITGTATVAATSIGSGIVNNLQAGTFVLTATDATTGCIATTIGDVDEPAQVNVTLTGTDPTILNALDGTITPSGSGGTAPYTFTSSGGSFTSLGAGIYTVTITDANGCTDTETIQLFNPGAVICSVTKIDDSCSLGNTGSITLDASGGIGTLTYTTTNLGGATGTTYPTTFANLGAGNYTFTVTDANGGSCIATTTITQPTPLVATITSSTPGGCTVSNGTATAIGSGSNGGYSYQWANTGGNAAIGVGLTAGAIYTCTVTDSKLCTAQTTVLIGTTANPSVTAITTTPDGCSAGGTGTITITASGVAAISTYSITPGISQANNSFSGLLAQAYVVTVTDANGCTGTSNALINTAANPTITNVTTTATGCLPNNTGSLTVTATSGVAISTYSITPGASQASNIFTGLTAQPYVVTVTDANGCTNTSNVVINTVGNPTIANISTTATGCSPNNTGSLTVTATSGVAISTYSITPGSSQTGNVFTALTAQPYVITATDANGCTSTSNVNITTAGNPSITNIVTTPTGCSPNNTGSLTVTATSGVAISTYSINPGGSQAGNVFGGLTAQQYTITVTDANGCTSQSTAVINTIGNPTANITGTTPALCAGDSTGTATFTTNSTNYTASIAGPATTSITSLLANTYIGLEAGTFTITVTDNVTGCTATTTSSIAPTPALSITANGVSTSGANLQDGSITGTITNGTAPYTIIVLDGSGNIVPTPQIANSAGAYTFDTLFAGNYTVVVIDANLCIDSATATVIEPGQMLCVVDSVKNVTCNGLSNGIGYVSALGGVPFGGLNYTWTLAASGSITAGQVNPATATGLAAGVYTFTATDQNGNSCTNSFTITQPQPLLITGITATPVTCTLGATLSTTATAGTPNYEHRLDAGAYQGIGTSFTNVAAGTHTITVRDANGCTAQSTINLAAPTAPSITNIAADASKCNPNNTGILTVTATSSNGALVYGTTSSPTNPSNVLTGLPSGTYTVWVQDAYGCTNSSTVLVPIAPNPVIDSIPTTLATCAPGNDGTATVFATSNAGIVTYAVNPAAVVTGSLISGMTGLNTSYTITVTDGNGCTATSNVVIGTLNAPTLSNLILTPTQCSTNNAVGAAALTASFTTGGTVSINPSVGIPAPTITSGAVAATGLFAGTYTITVTDPAGCSITTTINIATTPAVQITGNIVTNILCNGGNNGAISLSTNVGSLFDATLQSTGGGPISNSVTAAFNTLTAGSYQVIAIDSNYCKDTAVLTITQPAVLTLNTPTLVKITCNGDSDGSYTTTASGGTATYNYTITGPSAYIDSNTNGNFTGLATGTYTVVVRDNNGCTTSNTGLIQDVPLLAFGPATLTNPSCFGDSNGVICIAATGGNVGGLVYGIIANPAGYNAGCFNGLAAGAYSIVVTDNFGCSDTVLQTLVNPTAVTLVVDSLKNVACFGQSNGVVEVIAGGGQGAPYQYSLNGGPYSPGNLYTGLPAGTYTICARDVNLCSTCITVTVTQPTVLAYGGFTFSHITCNGQANGTITPGVTGGTPNYNTVLTAAGILPVPLGGDTIFTALAPNTYTISTTDANGCAVTTTITLTEPQPLVASTDSIHHITCFGLADGYISVVPPTGGTPPYLYILYSSGPADTNTTPAFNNLVAGNYTVDIIDSNGCTATTNLITLTEPPALVFTNATPTHVLCYGDATGAIATNVTGGTLLPSGFLPQYNFVMSGPSSGTPLFSNTGVNYTALTAGVYSINVTDAQGCTTSTLVSITQNALIYIDTFNFVPPRCFGESNGEVFVIGAGGVPPVLYALPPVVNTPQTANEFTGLPSQIYTLQLVDAVGCIVDTVFNLTQPDPLRFVQFNTTDANCDGANDGVISVEAAGGNGGYTYSIVPGVRVSFQGTFGGIAPGVYTVQVTDSKGCTITQDEIIGINPNPLEVGIAVVDSIRCGSIGNEGAIVATATGGSSPFTYLWNTTIPQTTSQINNLTPGFYSVTVTDGSGCTGTAEYFLSGAACCEAFMPNVFSPNGDGLNDKFRPVSAANIDVIAFRILDRWGNQVYNSLDIFAGWDGRVNNVDADNGSYYYIFHYYCPETQETYKLGGDLMLVR
jgi:gliding motility-associated-like protein